MNVSSTQLGYLRIIAEQPGPVPASEAFTRFRMSKLSVSRLIEGGMIQKEMIDGRSHYRLTAGGIAAVSAA